MSTMKLTDCEHYATVPKSRAQGTACAECGAPNPIRVCLTCGHVGCCDSSRGHATAHAKASGHPIIRSLPISERSFTWCYECNEYLT
jgi:monovalent cation/hydrogen antiporter